MSDHGTRARYLRGCKCASCVKANADYCKRYKLRVLTDPDSTGVDVEQAAQHIAYLYRLGMSAGAIAKASGVPVTVIRRLGDQKRVRATTARAILRVRITDNVGRCQIGATGTTRRIQGLRALGYSLAKIAAAVDYPYSMLRRIEDGSRPRVEYRTAAKVRGIYDAWSMRPPTATDRHERGAISKARNTAARRGYLPPLAWDDDLIDDPDVMPGEERADRSSHIPEDIEWLLELHPLWTAEQIAERLGVSRSGVQRALERAGRDDLAAILRRNVELVA